VSSCVFTYKIEKTPIQYEVLPRTTVPGGSTNWYGDWKITNTDQIDSWKVGDQICGRFVPD